MFETRKLFPTFASVKKPILTTSKSAMRIALALMLFQLFAPIVFPVMGQENLNTNTLNYHAQHNSSVLPILLKEKEEKEYEESLSNENLILILDLSTHSANLTATHNFKSNHTRSNLSYALQPALFTRHCSFLIWAQLKYSCKTEYFCDDSYRTSIPWDPVSRDTDRSHDAQCTL